MRFLIIRFVCICFETSWIWIVDCFLFHRIFFRFCMFYLTEWVCMNKTQSISETNNLLIIRLKMIDLIKAVDSMMIDLGVTDSIERLIAVERLLARLICMYVDVTEAVCTLFEKWFDVDFEIDFFKITVHFWAMNRF